MSPHTYQFIKGCDSCPLSGSDGFGAAVCQHPEAKADMIVSLVTPDTAHPDCPLRTGALHLALEKQT